jgi:hypothetical protein
MLQHRLFVIQTPLKNSLIMINCRNSLSLSKEKWKVFITTFISFTLFMASTALFAQRKNLLLESTFQDSAASMQQWYKGAPKKSAITVSKAVTHNGHPSLRFELNKTDSTIGNGKRSEISLNYERKRKVEKWFGWSVYLPKSYVFDYEPEIIAQWHDIPDADLNEKATRSPPIALNTYLGRYMLQVIWAAAPVNTNKTVDGLIYPDLGPYETGKWTNWVFHIKFSWENDGILEIWKNGVKVYSRYGPNSYNDENTPYFKLGIYKWMWMPNQDQGHSLITNRVLYISDIRIGDANATYKDVDPSQK